MVNPTAVKTVVLTFDNLGEASELERGTLDGSFPIGDHPSVTDVLPRLLGELDGLGLRAIFFVEGINCELYPGAVRAIAGRGHEVAAHGWRHEAWAELDPARERQLLERATAAFRSLGILPVGFRPPGGGLTASTPQLLRELGYRWCSPAIDAIPEDDHGLRWVPFDWELVDAYYLMESFASLRVQRGEPSAPLKPAAVAERFARILRDGRPHSTRTVILHPFLLLDEAWFQAARRTLALIAELLSSG
jgi:peptidoglycan/xylan/chitin deacetylase (PgdA/CDA1 family)